MNNNQKLLNKIEFTREQLFKTAESYSLTSNKVIELSKKLDTLLNIYAQSKRKKEQQIF
jgi:hypothetical protein